MASKKIKKRENQEANNGSVTWPDLPEQLITLLSNEPILIATIRGSGVTKSWRSRKNDNCGCLSSSTGSHPLPWLEISDHPLGSKPTPDYSTISFRPNQQKVYRYARSWLVYSLNTRGDNSLSDDQFPDYWRRGSWIKKTYALVWNGNAGDPIPYFFCNMTGPNGMAYGRKKLDCDTVDPNCHHPSESSHFFRIANGIGFQDRFYVLSLQGTLAVVEETGSDWELKITRVGKMRAVPSVKSRYFREFMVESDGKVLVVFLVSRQSIEVVDDVEVYQVDAEDLALVKKKSINGGRSLFLGTNCAMSVLASQVVCRKRNCVYFTIYAGHGWSVYDMDLKSISDACM